MAVKIWGHRGCRGENNPPENSLASFQAAIDQGADGIELDLSQTRDGHLVVFHDDTLRRMTDGKGRITDYTLADLKKLHLRYSSGELSRERIPTYEEVLDLVERHMNSPAKGAKGFVVNTEIKGLGIAAPVANALEKRLAHGWRVENLQVSSFDMANLWEMKNTKPDIPRGAVLKSMLGIPNISEGGLATQLARIKDIAPSTVNITYPSLTPGALKMIREAGAMPVAWTPGSYKKNPATLSHAEKQAMARHLGDNHIVMITDYPREMRRLLEKNQQRALA